MPGITFGVKTVPEMEKLSILKEIGFKYVELFTNKKYLGNADIARRFGFEYIVHAPTDFFDDSVIDFAEKIGSKMIVIHYRPEIQDFKKLVRRAKNCGIQLCIENSPGVGHPNPSYRDPVTPEEFLELKKQFPEIKLCLDVEHAMMAKMFPRILKMLSRDVGYVHVTGYPPRYHSPPFLNRSMFEIAMRELRNAGYDGIVTAEMDPEWQTEEVFRKLKDFFSEFAEKK